MSKEVYMAKNLIPLNELSIGMKVFREQLLHIYDTWIILYRPKNIDMEEDGIVGFIGKETNEKSAALYNENNVIIPIFNDSLELEDDIYEE